MAKTFRLQIVTPEKVEFDEEVEVVVAPGIDGELGIMAGHLPLITRLKIGVLRILTASEEITMAVSEGYMEVTRDKVLILAEAANARGDRCGKGPGGKAEGRGKTCLW